MTGMPALTGIEDDWSRAFVFVITRQKDVDLAYLDTPVAADAKLGIDADGIESRVFAVDPYVFFHVPSM